MEPATMMAIAAGASALIGGLSAKDQGDKAAKASKEAIKAQEEADRKNLIASAYGIGAPVRGTAGMQAPAGIDPMIAALGGGLQGGLAGAQFAEMNPNLWDSGGDAGTAALQQQIAKTKLSEQAAQQSLMRPTVDIYGQPIPTFNPGGLN